MYLLNIMEFFLRNHEEFLINGSNIISVDRGIFFIPNILNTSVVINEIIRTKSDRYGSGNWGGRESVE